MTAQAKDGQEAVNQVYDFAANLMLNEGNSAAQAKAILMMQGVDAEDATVVIDNLEKQIALAKKESANKDLLYGALWCAGGTIGTLADVGFIFWGAIIFGAIQFVKGVINSSS